MIWLMLIFCFQKDPDWLLYQQARDAMEKRDYQTAIQRLEAAVAQDPVSKEHNKTYGVQLEPYYPYHLLAEAYLWTKDLDKAAENLTKAYEYNEDQDPGVRMSLEFTERYLENLRDDSSLQPQVDMSPVWDALADGQLARAAEALAQLRRDHPHDSTVQGIGVLLGTLVNNRNRLLEANQRLNALREEEQAEVRLLLSEAETFEASGQLNEAFSRYLAALTMDETNRIATAGLERVRGELEAQGRSQAELEQQVQDAREERDSALNAEIRRLSQQSRSLRSTNDQLLKEINRFREMKPAATKPTFDYDFFVSPTQDKSYTADVQVRVSSNVPLKDARLLVNGKEVARWPVPNGNLAFRSPVIEGYDFGNAFNQLLIKGSTVKGDVFEKPHQYKFPVPAPSWTPRIIAFAIYTLLALLTFYFFMRIRRRRQMFRNRFNPYIAGAPILNDRMFYGRKPLLKQILNTLHNNSLMIYGERRIGKTSFLHQLHAVLPEMEDPHYAFTPVFLDLQGVTEDQFFSFMDHEIMQSLAAQDIRLEEPQRNVDARLFTSRLRRAINELKQRNDKSPKLVLLLDEVDIMNGFTEHTNQQLRSVFMKGFARHLVAVMAGIHINKQWKSEGSPWYNFFEQIQLKPFSEEHATQLITEPVRGVYQYQPEAVKRIIDITGGKPYLIQKLCVNLVAHILKQNRRRITLKDVDSVFEDIKSEVFTAS